MTYNVEEQTLMRIFIGENDRSGRRPLMEVLLELFLAEGLAGATVLKGAAGFGVGSALHSDRYLRLAADLPVVIEVVDTAENIDAVLPKLDGLIGSGLVTLEKARIIRYR
jgi:PII-like signaling protein